MRLCCWGVQEGLVACVTKIGDKQIRKHDAVVTAHQHSYAGDAVSINGSLNQLIAGLIVTMIGYQIILSIMGMCAVWWLCHFGNALWIFSVVMHVELVNKSY